MAGSKTISILSLIVVVALAGALPVFARNGIILSPEAGCSGTMVIISFPGEIEERVKVSSIPDGLITEFNCAYPYTGLECQFRVSESASCGSYTVRVDLENDEVIGSAPFEVLCDCPVGGCVQPVNTFALLSPWLAVIGVVGCVSTIVVVAKRHGRD